MSILGIVPGMVSCKLYLALPEMKKKGFSLSISGVQVEIDLRLAQYISFSVGEKK